MSNPPNIELREIYKAAAEVIKHFTLSGLTPISLKRVSAAVSQLLKLEDAERHISSSLVAGFSGIRESIGCNLVEALSKDPYRVAGWFQSLVTEKLEECRTSSSYLTLLSDWFNKLAVTIWSSPQLVYQRVVKKPLSTQNQEVKTNPGA